MPFIGPAHLDPPIGVISSHDARNVPLLGTSSPASSAYPAANLAIYVPFTIGMPVTVYEAFLLSGTLTTSNTVQIGIYNEAGTRLWNTADITVAVASSIINSSSTTDITLSSGVYYMAFACSGTRNFFASTLALGNYQASGCLEETGLTGSTLPASATFAVYTRAYLPVFGLNLRTDVL